ncbi:MAG: class IV adenylate cyclase [Treponema sp.]|jgi:adenylate cyclase class 2|nr:class IV adenylate cyclase [Treponema sp.]
MPFEIELKAHLEDSQAVEGRLSALGAFCRSYKKSDSYWLPMQEGGEMSIPPAGVRVRRESGIDAGGTAHESVLVTYKTKEISDGIEVNDEREFEVSDALLFEDLLARLGLQKAICKEKQGRSWSVPPVLAEVSLVAGLGWFLELEIIADNDDRHIIEKSRGQLLSLLEKLEIQADRIEAMPYTAMLRELSIKEDQSGGK